MNASEVTKKDESTHEGFTALVLSVIQKVVDGANGYDKGYGLALFKQLDLLAESEETATYRALAELFTEPDTDELLKLIGHYLNVNEITVKRHLDERAARREQKDSEPSLTGRMLQVFPSINEAKAKNMAEAISRDNRKGAEQDLTAMAGGRGVRALPDLMKAIPRVDALKVGFPNFARAIDTLIDEMILNQRSHPEQFRIRPVLLDGAPGIGKTAFALALAEAMGIGFEKISAGGMQHAAALTGTARHWANTSSGAVFKLLAYGKYATAVLIVDEVDKLSSDDRYSILPALLDLLEPASARQYKDESLQVTFDASRLIVLLTSNDTSNMAPPLLSRVDTHRIVRPTKQDRFDIGIREFKSLRKGLEKSSRMRIDESALMELASLDIDLRALLSAVRKSVATALRSRKQVAVPVTDGLEAPRMGFY